jgi:hypothetical protein
VKRLILAVTLLGAIPGAWAYNALTPDTADILGGTDLSGAMLRLQRYCEAHPADSLAQAMLALTAELYPGRRTR